MEATHLVERKSKPCTLQKLQQNEAIHTTREMKLQIQQTSLSAHCLVLDFKV